MTEEMANSVLNNVSRAVGALKAELRVAEHEGPMSICSANVRTDDRATVHILGSGWVKLCGIFREYQVEVHGEYDKDKPWNERCFKLWFIYNNVEFFCLMTGKELLNVGCALPCEGKTIKRSGGVDQWLKGVQCTAV